MNKNITVETIDNGYLVVTSCYNNDYDNYDLGDTYVPPKRVYCQTPEDVAAAVAQAVQF